MLKNKSSASYDIFESPVGTLYLIFAGNLLTGISFRKPSQIAFKRGSALKNFIGELSNYFKGCDVNFSPKIKFLKGTDFEKKVWDSLKTVPFGKTRSYKWLAEKLGNPNAVRAVGQALAKNPIPIVLPCHRIIESSGSLGGYSSGTDIKRRLLEMEYYSKL